MIQKKSLTLFCLFLDLQKLPSAQTGLPVGGRFGSSKFSTLGNIYVSFTFVLPWTPLSLMKSATLHQKFIAHTKITFFKSFILCGVMSPRSMRDEAL